MVTKRKGFKVTQGQIVVDSIDVIRSTRNVLVVEADCYSKYPDVAMSSGSTVWLAATEDTLWCDREAKLTVIELPEHVADWTIVFAATKYTVKIVAYRRPKRRTTEVWHKGR